MTFFSKTRIVKVSIGEHQFAWDIEKDAINAQKHGVVFSEAITVFDDHMYLDAGTENIHGENRHHIIGSSLLRRQLFVVSCDKDEQGVITIISARLATKEECKRYLAQF